MMAPMFFTADRIHRQSGAAQGIMSAAHAASGTSLTVLLYCHNALLNIQLVSVDDFVNRFKILNGLFDASKVSSASAV